MARIRTIKPEFPQSESMGRVGRESRLCFILLWTIADDEGRLRGNSRMLSSLLYPYDDDAKDKIEGWLTELSTEGCIARYEVSGASYIQIESWLDHQKIDKPSASKIPEKHANSRRLSKPRDDSIRKGREGKGEEGGEDSCGDLLAKSQPAPALPPAVLLPLNDSSDYPIDQQMIDEWSKTYPAVDVLQELREMRSWCNANKTQRKTRRGVDAFICRWLGKEQDKGGQKRTSSQSEIGAFL